MDRKLIIISRNSGAESYINNIKGYSLATEENTVVIYPTDTEYETTLIKGVLDPSKANLVIYDSSTTLIDNATLQDNVNTIQGYGIELVFLGKYLDTCSKYSLQNTVPPAGSVSMVTGTEPVGFNAILMTGEFAGKLQTELNSKMYYSIIYAILNMNPVMQATSPNIFVYNPLYNSLDDGKVYNVKTEECQGITSQITPPSDNNLNIFWIIIIVVVVVFIFWLFVNFTDVFSSSGVKGTETLVSVKVVE
jgi:hypothetical protein